jgi:6-phospho-beta-glucosidase
VEAGCREDLPEAMPDMTGVKIAVIGGGSTYTPELVRGLLEVSGTLPVAELCLMDIDEGRLRDVGGFARRMVDRHGRPFVVRLTQDRREAIRGSAYVLTQLRVGGMRARREDEYLGRRHGLIGQETTGIGGMAKALRTIPVVLEIARTVAELSPGAVLANFTNPAGLVTEAIARHAPSVRAVGLCNVAITAKAELVRILAERGGVRLDPDEARLDTLGLNHLSWHRGLAAGGQEYWPQVLEAYLSVLAQQADAQWNPELIRALGMVPNDYLGYYYETKKKLAAQSRWPPSRAEDVMRIEAGLLERYRDPALTDMPAELLQRGGAHYSTLAARVLNAIHNDLGEVHVLNAPHRGAVPSWPADWVLELPCRVAAGGIEPLPAEPLPPACAGLVAQVKSHELLTVEAAVHGDRQAAFQALLAHPLGPQAHDIEAVLEDLLRTHRAYLPQFWE